jgi:hypothetical protein
VHEPKEYSSVLVYKVLEIPIRLQKITITLFAKPGVLAKARTLHTMEV